MPQIEYGHQREHTGCEGAQMGESALTSLWTHWGQIPVKLLPWDPYECLVFLLPHVNSYGKFPYALASLSMAMLFLI